MHYVLLLREFMDIPTLIYRKQFFMSGETCWLLQLINYISKFILPTYEASGSFNVAPKAIRNNFYSIRPTVHAFLFRKK